MLAEHDLDTLFRTARTFSHQPDTWLPVPVSEAQLRQVWDLARMGPTSANCSPMRVVFVTTPALWPAWPFLPVVRRRREREREELGVLFDARGVYGLTGYSATVFLANVFELPRQLDVFLALPREVYDCGEELIASGWRVD